MRLKKAAGTHPHLASVWLRAECWLHYTVTTAFSMPLFDPKASAHACLIESAHSTLNNVQTSTINASEYYDLYVRILLPPSLDVGNRVLDIDGDTNQSLRRLHRPYSQRRHDIKNPKIYFRGDDRVYIRDVHQRSPSLARRPRTK